MKSIFKHIIVFFLTLEARILLSRTHPTIIAVTGNVGKTSTKDVIYAVLKDHVHARKSEKSYNSEIGVPLSVLGLQNAWNNPFHWVKNLIDGALVVIHPGAYPKVLVLEVGVDRPGDMRRLAKWIKPDVVVFTRLPDMPVHVEFFSSPDAVVTEKKRLIEALKPDGVLVYNHDDKKAAHIAEDIPQQSIGFSRHAHAPFMTSGDTIVYEDGKPTGISFTVTHLEKIVPVIINHTLGIQNAYNVAAAAAVGSLFQITLTEVAEAVRVYEPPPGRMRIITGIKDTLIIDDSYNSSPAASETSLQTLKELKGVGRRIAVLGDMLELGKYSVREHERVGKQVAGIADVLLTIGVRARGIATGAQSHGMHEKKIFQYEDATQAGKELEAMLKPGDVVLIKGSQGIRAERVVEKIMQEPERASELLVRQSAVWKSI
jgi:UDP-N-acetylmuramoyl-tripeptide--D-alanyl-D-alanine ligase